MVSINEGSINRLLKILWKKENPNKNSDKIIDEELIEISKNVFNNLDIVLINFLYKENYSRKKINRIETLLRASTETLNQFKTKKIKDLNIIVDNY